jgi:predicted permease
MVCLALAMGVNATLFSFLNSMFFRRLPVPEADRLIRATRKETPFCRWREFQAIRPALRTADAAATLLFFDDVEIDRRSYGANVEMVSANYAAVLRPGIAIGTWFAETAGTDGDVPVVISYPLWKSRLNGDHAALGKAIHAFNRPARIVGVAAPEYLGDLTPLATDIWMPALGPAALSEGRANLIARLRPHATVEEARAELQVVGARLAPEDPVEVRPIAGFVRRAGGAFVPIAGLMSAVCGVVLLIACVNVANLLLSRAAVRRHEIALRRALGAGRGRIFRETLAEGIVIAFGGVVLGLIAGYGAGRALELALPSVPLNMYRGIQLAIDWRVAALLAAAGIASALLFSLPRGLAVGRESLNLALKHEGGRRRSRQREIYTVAQVALSLALLIAAGLLVRALQTVQQIGPGFATDHRLALTVWSTVKDPAAERCMFDTLLQDVRDIPGVRSATLAWQVFGSAAGCLSLSQQGEPMSTAGNVVEPNYFDAMRIPIVAGRGFAPAGTLADRPDVIVNEALAHDWWPGESPLGKTVWVGCQAGSRRAGLVTGVARNATYGYFGGGPEPYHYLSRLQDRGNGSFGIVAETAGNPREWAKPLLAAADRAAGLRVYDTATLDDIVGQALWEARWEASLLGGLGLLAVALAAIGLYGVVAYGVSQRTREIGVRMALGAVPRDVHRLILGHGLRVTLLGIGCGLALSAATVRLLRGFLFGLNPFDPVTFIAAAFCWTAIATLACWLPARRATRVDPLSALKYE